MAHIGQNIKTVEETLLISKENAPIGQKQKLKKKIDVCKYAKRKRNTRSFFSPAQKMKSFFPRLSQRFFNSAYAGDISVACL